MMNRTINGLNPWVWFPCLLLPCFIVILLSACGGGSDRGNANVFEQPAQAATPRQLQLSMSLPGKVAAASLPSGIQGYLIVNDVDRYDLTISTAESTAIASIPLPVGNHTARVIFESIEGTAGKAITLASKTDLSVIITQDTRETSLRVDAGEYDVSFDDDGDGITNWEELVGRKPIADAGSDSSYEVNQLVTLDGGNSQFFTNEQSYQWTFTVPTGSSAGLSNSTIRDPSFTPDLVGNYIAQLIVNNGLADSDPVSITIGASPKSPRSVFVQFSVVGLKGSGLTLQNNGKDDFMVTSNGRFSFSEQIFEGDRYDITVMAQPTELNQICTVQDGTGIALAADSKDIVVNCELLDYTVGGTVDGLQGSSLVLALVSGDVTEQISIETTGAFVFPIPLDDGSTYTITVAATPSQPAQICNIANGSGNVGGANVADVVASCALIHWDEMNWDQGVWQ